MPELSHVYTWAILVSEEDGSTTASCNQSHSDFTIDDIEAKTSAWQDEFPALQDSAIRSLRRGATRVTAATGSARRSGAPSLPSTP